MSRREKIPGMTRALEALLRPPLALITKRDYRGLENLPKEGGFVLAANHNSHVDPILLARFVLDTGYVPRYLAKDSLFTHSLTGPILRGADQIPVARFTESAKNALGPTVEALRAGKPVIIYPEGTITRDPEAWPMSGRTGAVRAALEAGVPLIPICQSGAQDILWPYTKKPHLLPRHTHHVWVGPPMDLSMYEGKPINEEMLHEATTRLMDILTDMMSEMRGTRPTTPRIDVHTVKKVTKLGEDNS
ncbi:MAG TPA: lysophospholipid acyltransferase family protein [Aeromicrobium sp.]|nr:lysophospholipid acyltransferase family protein [Aeromicrobium sp.]HKY59033.1 lysophospholipid acyltransferase family protein [Aeromicrobium sp.]